MELIVFLGAFVVGHVLYRIGTWALSYQTKAMKAASHRRMLEQQEGYREIYEYAHLLRPPRQ